MYMYMYMFFTSECIFPFLIISFQVLDKHDVNAWSESDVVNSSPEVYSFYIYSNSQLWLLFHALTVYVVLGVYKLYISFQCLWLQQVAQNSK